MNKYKKICILFVCMIYVVSIFCGCKKSSSSIASNKKIIKIGICESLSGVYSEMGTCGVLGARYANELYDTIEIEGEKYKIELVEVDNQSTKDDSIDACKKLINHKVSFVIGGYDTEASLGMVEVLDKANIPLFICGSSNIELTNGKRCTYRMCKDDAFVASCVASYIKNQGGSSVAILYDKNETYNDNIIKYFERACSGLSLSVAGNMGIDTASNDYKNVLNDIKEKEVEYIYMLFDGKVAPRILAEMRDMGINSEVMGSDMWEYSGIIDEAGSACEGLHFLSYFDGSDIDTKTGEEFLHGDAHNKGFINYLIANSKSEYVYPEAAFSYDAYMTIYNAISNANSIKIEDVISHIENITFEGVTGIISFDDNGDVKKEKGYIKSIKDGEVDTVESINLDNIG